MFLGRPVSVWFGPEESPLFGSLHVPDGLARGAILLCPPLGREYTNSHSTFGQLAIRLTELGFAALRFDYRSTGDSFDRATDDSGGCGFVQDVQFAVDFVRTMDVTHIGIVGMRLGANFASVHCGCEPVDTLVLWDPCPTGRSFLREQRALGMFYRARAADENADALDLPGFKMSSEMSREIADLDLVAGQPRSAEGGELADKVLLLTRSGRVADRKLAESFDLPHVEHREVTGQLELLDVAPPNETVPADALATVTGWLDKVMPQGGFGIAAPANGEVRVRISPDGSSPVPGEAATLVRERAVRLGPTGLFGIETESETTGSGPVCIFVSVSNEHRIGPGRMWVLLSRRLAANGFRCVRIDVNGFGDSPARDGRPVSDVCSILAIDDILDTARAVSPEDPSNVVLFGLSSSAYNILEAALILAPRGICALNPMLMFQPPEMDSGGAIDVRRRFCLPRTALVAVARKQSRVRWFRHRFLVFSSRLLRPVRMVALRLRSVVEPFRNRPRERLEDLVEAGTEVLLISGPEEVLPFLAPGTRAVHRAQPDERLGIRYISTLEHALLFSRDRDQVTGLILDYIFTRFPRSPER